MGTHKNNEKMVTSGMFLPDEMIIEILSRLPIISLLRFKCVCKIWYSTIEDPVFIVKQNERARYAMVSEEDQGTEFTAIITTMGVTLERHTSNNTYRLRNLATRQILNLPSSREKKGVCKSLAYIKPTNELKVVYIDFSKRGNKKFLIYNVLRVGAHFTWKRLDSPLLGDLRNVKPSVWPTFRVIGAVFYKMRLVDDLYIDCLDLENESITSIKVPRDLFYEWEDIWAINWKGKLSFARIERDQLKIRVLENYSKHKWADSKIVISLTFFASYLSPSISVEQIIPYAVENNQVCWRIKGYYQFLSFDTQTKEVKYLPPPTQKKFVRIYRPSLLSLHFRVQHPQNQIEETRSNLLFKFSRFLRLSLLGV